LNIRSALIITIAAILFLIPAIALGQGTSKDDSDQELEFQIGDKIFVLEGVQKHRIGTVTGFTGTFYHVEGLPHEYMGSEYYSASELARAKPPVDLIPSLVV